MRNIAGRRRKPSDCEDSNDDKSSEHSVACNTPTEIFVTMCPPKSAVTEDDLAFTDLAQQKKVHAENMVSWF